MPIFIKLKDLIFDNRVIQYSRNDLFELIVDRDENG